MSSKVFAFFSLTLLSFLVRTDALADSLNLLPTAPYPESNPHIAKAFEGVRTGNTAYVGDAKDQDETMVAALAYLHPNSPYKGQTAMLDRLLVLLDGRFSLWTHDKNLGDHMSSFQPTYAYLALKTYAPDKIPPEKKAAWEAAIAKHTAYLIDNNPNIYKEHLVGALVVNMDIFRTMSVWLGGCAVGDAASAAIGKSAVEDCMTKCSLGDGATHYANYSNEVFLYHNSIVWGASWYYLLSGSPKMKKFLDGMAHYIPMSQHVGGFADYSTAPPWKPFYVENCLQKPALAMAYLTGDPYDFAIGQSAQKMPAALGDSYLAFLYRPALTAKEAPTDYMLYDRNTLGPRGYFGAWGVVGTTRDPSSPAPEVNETPTPGMVGLSTVVGAFALKGPDSPELNAAFHGACPEVKITQGPEQDMSRGNHWAFLTGTGCHNAVSKSQAVYGLSTCYQINNRGGYTEKAYTGWDGVQGWVFTPDRVIGLSAISTRRGRRLTGWPTGSCSFPTGGHASPGMARHRNLPPTARMHGGMATFGFDCMRAIMGGSTRLFTLAFSKVMPGSRMWMTGGLP